MRFGLYQAISLLSLLASVSARQVPLTQHDPSAAVVNGAPLKVGTSGDDVHVSIFKPSHNGTRLTSPGPRVQAHRRLLAV
ncbi:hypothetical protein B0T24DRAFT_632416 [Lasiosphaeria ovina]|uniref:Uncharacterized protein n=1 Tax=Lasiosphaeria ovina TaxID=92902 RepID=A0AAE0K4L8_9PEZI|nr:hypothetical protein B0T24DRAFT_632416 [Lasiosphaeria ovina]